MTTAIDAGWVERKLVIDSGRHRVPVYRMADRWHTADRFEALPREVLPALIGLGAGHLRHWLALRVLAGGRAMVQAPDFGGGLAVDYQAGHCGSTA